jgi:radical SAM protein with 4Fe4S-binding SPASM domain
MLGFNPMRRITEGFLRYTFVDKDNDLCFLDKETVENIQANIVSHSKLIIPEDEKEFIKSNNFIVPCPNHNVVWDNHSIITNLYVESKATFENKHLWSFIKEVDAVLFVEVENFTNTVKELLEKVYHETDSAIDLFVKHLDPQQLLELSSLACIHSVGQIYFDMVVGDLDLLDKEKLKLFQFQGDKSMNCAIHLKPSYLLFSESQAHHTYFNRKLYIGPNGEIKNAPECPETFGYIQDLESPEQLKAIVQTPEFQKYWFVHKEITDVCKDCEFRHMCVDNRLPHQRTENEWYHKTECNYNPYIAKWQGEEGYRTLAECGVISNENGFSIDHEKIAEINKELWGEDED